MLARDAMNVQRLLVNNPRDVSFEDALALYQTASLTGVRPHDFAAAHCERNFGTLPRSRLAGWITIYTDTSIT